MSNCELIARRRRQMVIHSYLYYKLGTNLISDDTWQAWADELTKLQQQHPECISIGVYDEFFADWTGATGCHLPTNAAEYEIAMRLLRSDP